MNNLGGDNGALVEPIAEALRFNKTLLHLDLCHCGLTPHMHRVIGDALRDNHTLLGIHFDDHKLQDGKYTDRGHHGDSNSLTSPRSELHTPRSQLQTPRSQRQSPRQLTQANSQGNDQTLTTSPARSNRNLDSVKRQTSMEWSEFFKGKQTNSQQVRGSIAGQLPPLVDGPHCLCRTWAKLVKGQTNML